MTEREEKKKKKKTKKKYGKAHTANDGSPDHQNGDREDSHTSGNRYHIGGSSCSSTVPPVLVICMSSHASWYRCVPTRFLYSNPTLTSRFSPIASALAHSLRTVSHDSNSSTSSYSGNCMQIRRFRSPDRGDRPTRNSSCSPRSILTIDFGREKEHPPSLIPIYRRGSRTARSPAFQGEGSWP